MRKVTTPALPAPLPDGIVAADLKPLLIRSKGDLYQRERQGMYEHDFDLWYTTGYGWCIPTLLIRNAPRRSQMRGNVPERTYAIEVKDGQVVRVGMGPHVSHRVRVYVRRSRLDALQKYIDLHTQGQEKAGTVRDRISSRRAQYALRRSEGSGLGRAW